MNLGAFKRLLSLCGYPQTRVLSSTWAARPAANSVPVGQILQITDYGNKLFYSDGTLWRRWGNAPWAQLAVAASVTGTVTETVLATIAIPAGLMGVNGMLRITPLWSVTNNANAKTLMVRLGGTSISTAGAASQATYQNLIILRNRGVANSQVSPVTASTGNGFNGSAAATFAIDTSVAQNLTLTGTLGNAADTITLEGYTVEILNP